jgi:transposase
MCSYRPINRHLPTIRKIPDDLWDEIKLLLLLPPEKSDKTIGRPVIPFRKVLDGIVYILRTVCQWKMLPKEYCSGSTCHRRFQEWTASRVFQKLWVRLLKVYDDLKGIRWTWQSLDSISVKVPLGGTYRCKSYRQRQIRNKASCTYGSKRYSIIC